MLYRIPNIAQVLHMSGLHKPLSSYAPLQIFDRVLDTPLVLKCQHYRELRFLCKLYFRDSRYSEYAPGSQYTKILNVSGILICQSILIGFLMYLRFWIWHSSEFVLEITLNLNIQEYSKKRYVRSVCNLKPEFFFQL